MKRYWKGSDLQIEINITDKKGNTIPFANLDELTVYLKTTGEEYVKVSKGRGIESDVDGNIYIRLNEHSLDYLPDGLLRYDARWKISAEGWDNGYDTVQSCETDIFVKTPDNYIPKSNVQEKVVEISKNNESVDVYPDGAYEGIEKLTINVNIDESDAMMKGEIRCLRNEYTGDITVDCEPLPYLFKWKNYHSVNFERWVETLPVDFDPKQIVTYKYPRCIRYMTTGNMYSLDYVAEKTPYISDEKQFRDFGTNATKIPEFMNYLPYCYNIQPGKVDKLTALGNIYYFDDYSYSGYKMFTDYAKELDLTRNICIPKYHTGFTSPFFTKIIVPASLYDEWINNSGWTNCRENIVKGEDNFKVQHIKYKLKDSSIPLNITSADPKRYRVEDDGNGTITVYGNPYDTFTWGNPSNIEEVDFSDFYAPFIEWCSGMTNVRKVVFGTGDKSPSYFANMFFSCSSLEGYPNIDVSQGRNFISFFCSNPLETLPSGYDFSNGVNFQYFLLGSNIREIEANMPNAINFNRFAMDCKGLKSVNINIPMAEDMSESFYGCSNLTDIGNSFRYLPNLKNLAYGFAECSLTSIEMELPKLDSCHYAFGGNLALKEVKKFSVPSSCQMSYAFSGCSNLSTYISDNVTLDCLKPCDHMFYRCEKLRGNFLVNISSNCDWMFNLCRQIDNLTIHLKKGGSAYGACGGVSHVNFIIDEDAYDGRGLFYSCFANLSYNPETDSYVQDFSGVDLKNIEDATGMFNFASDLGEGYTSEEVLRYGNAKLITPDMSKVKKLESCFQRRRGKAPEMNTASLENAYQMFLFSYFDEIPEYDFSNVTNADSIFQYFYGTLTTLGGFRGLKVSMNLSMHSSLTHDSIMNVITKAADVTASPKTLTLGSTNLSKLTDEEKGIATAKGWTLA